MRVSLQIDGDASGAQKAAQDASNAVQALGKTAESAGASIDKASGSASGLAKSAEAAGAANDNFASSAAAIAQKVADIASKATGAQSALVKAAQGATGLAEGVAAVGRSAGAVSILTGVLGIAVTAVTTFYDVINRGSKSVEQQLEDQTKLIGMIRDAYVKAKGAAGDFYEYGANATKLLLLQNEAELRKTLQTQVGSVLSSATTFANPGDFVAQIKQVKSELLPFEDAIFRLQQGFKSGAPDVKAFVDEVARIALANPELQKAATELINKILPALNTFNRLSQNASGAAVIDGKATADDLKKIGAAAESNVGSFDRFAKAVDRQSASMEAEAKGTGQAIGEATRLRTEFILTEAATQSGEKSAARYAARIAEIAKRAGEAAQKLAEAKLQSDVAFERSQLGRTADEAAVADRLRSVYGDNADLNGAAANAIRFNNDMRELKATTQDLASGALRDVQSQLQSGVKWWQAFEQAGLNAANKLIQKFADKTFDTLISGLFSSFLGGGSSLFGGGGSSLTGTMQIGSQFFPTIGFDSGGFTGSGGRYQPAGVVHAGEYVFDQDSVNRAGVGFFSRLHRNLRGYADGGAVGSAMGIAGLGVAGGAPISFTYAPNIDARGADSQAVARLASVMEDDKKNFKRNVQAILVETKLNNPGFFGS